MPVLAATGLVMAEDLPVSPGEVLASLSRLEQAVTSIAGLVAAAIAATEGVQNVGILKDNYLKKEREASMKDAQEALVAALTQLPPEFSDWLVRKFKAELHGEEFNEPPPDQTPNGAAG